MKQLSQILIICTALAGCAVEPSTVTSEPVMIQRMESSAAQGDWTFYYQQVEQGVLGKGVLSPASARAMYAKNQAAVNKAGYDRIVNLIAQGTAPDYAKELVKNYTMVTGDTTGAEKLANMQPSGAAKTLTQGKVDALMLARDASFFGEIQCDTSQKCEKAFAITQAYIADVSSMKIQTATSNVIETYTATDKGKIGFKAVRTPNKKGETITLTAGCGGFSANAVISKNANDASAAEDCITKLEKIKAEKNFERFVKERL